MKTEILSIEGKKAGEIELPRIFEAEVREDIIQKTFEAGKTRQPYAPSPTAGKHHSASGNIRHVRHKWRTAYGKGISRVPRKTMWRRGTQFYWVGAEIASTRGGRRAHPPKLERREKKINKKEKKFAMQGAIASTAMPEKIKKRYSRLEDKEIVISLPIVVESTITSLNTKEFLKSLKNILKDFYEIAIPKKTIRAGKGKMRGRKYKKTAGVLFVVGKNENIKSGAIETKKISQLELSDLYPTGRLVVYTENAIKDLGEKFESGGKK